MFLDTYYHTIDPKGRITIPAKYRARLSLGCVVLPGFSNGSLALLDLETFQNLVTHIRQNFSLTDQKALLFQRSFMTQASDLELDGSGRINIPPRLRERASLEGEVVLAGMGTFIEIWKREQWEQILSAQENASDTLDFSDFGIILGSGMHNANPHP
ncbi:MAG TPA: division/cell wall cluster transcriptional repressor MraZ [Anaerolineales bacterium]|nr:division/cell wall cluster transcriptional repressor MraZ [Anaerolineales bacterium]